VIILPKILPENIKNEILTTTRRLVVEQGYNKISIRDITHACGIATGTFYNYYNSKQDVLSALLADDWNRMQLFLKARSQSSELTVIMQLEEVFNSLKAMMISVHELWSLGFPDDFASEAMYKMAQVKKQLHSDLAQSVQRIIHGHTEPEKESFLAGFIARMFLYYAYEDSIHFKDIGFVIEKIIS
jgi:AcrR family transcriptional regulator